MNKTANCPKYPFHSTFFDESGISSWNSSVEVNTTFLGIPMRTRDPDILREYEKMTYV